MRTPLYCAVFILFCVSCVPLAAQGMEQGVVEGAGSIGGIWLNGSGGNHLHLGGTFGAAVRERLFVFGELGYAPLTGNSTTTVVDGVPVRISASAKLVDFGGGVQYNLPTDWNFEPYVVGAVGAGRTSASGSAHVPGSNIDVSLSTSDTKARLGVGVGVRYYVSERWGVRPELRIDRYLGTGGTTAVRYTVGVFYQFGK